MAPVRRNPSFRHEPYDVSCYDPVQSEPIPTDAEDRSIDGETMEMAPRRQLEQPPICQKLLLPIKKRATSCESDASSDQSSADGSFMIPPKKRRVESGSDGSSAAYRTPLQAHQHDTVTVCARAASPKPTSSSAITAIRFPQLPQKKLTHNGIRSGGVLPDHRLLLHGTPSHGLERAATSAAGAARAKKKTSRNKDKKPRPGAAVTFFRTRPLRLSENVSRHLAELGVGRDGDTAPKFVCLKTLGKSDVEKNQNRLLFSCKRESFDGHPISALFAGIPRETYYVHKHEPGLLVSSLDGHGTEFKVKLRYLYSNFAYRLIGGWGAFVRGNELFAAFQQGRRVEVELWSFRSPLLPGQPVLKENDDERKVVEGLEDHPNGALGLLFLPYVDGHPAWEPYVDDGHPAPAREEMVEERERAPRPRVHETKRRASAKVVHGTKKQQAPANVVPAERKLEDHHRLSANKGKAVVPEMTFQDIARACGENIAYACVGLLKLANSTRFV